MSILNFFIVLLGIVISLIIIKKPFMGVIFMLALEPVKSVIPSPMLASYAPTLIGSLTVVSFFMVKFKTRSRKDNTPLSQPRFLYFFIGWFLVSIFFGQYFASGTAQRDFFLTFGQLAILVWLIVNLVIGEKEIKILMSVMLAAIFINSIIGITQTWFGLSTLDTLIRASGLTGNQNEFSIYATIGFIYCYYFWNHSLKGFKLLIVLFAGVFLAAIFFSGSRGGILFTGVSILYLLLQSGKVKIQSFSFIIIIILMVLAFWRILPAELQIRFMEIPTVILQGSDTVGVRYDAWRIAYTLWLQHPIFGIGAGRFTYYNWFNNLVPGHTYIVPHNMYMTVLSEEGLFGFIPFLGMIITVAIYLFQASKNTVERKGLLDLAIAWQTIFLFLCLTGLKGSIEYQKFLWMNFGISAVVMRISKKMEQENANH